MTPPREPRTALCSRCGHEDHDQRDDPRCSEIVAVSGPDSLAEISYEPVYCGCTDVDALYVRTMRAEAAGAPLRERDYGLVFGKVMQKHPKADVRLVNDLLRTTLGVLAVTPAPAPLDVESLAVAVKREIASTVDEPLSDAMAHEVAVNLAREYLTARAAAAEDTDAQ